jgi:hypothetical protein
MCPIVNQNANITMLGAATPAHADVGLNPDKKD